MRKICVNYQYIEISMNLPIFRSYEHYSIYATKDPKAIRHEAAS